MAARAGDAVKYSKIGYNGGMRNGPTSSGPATALGLVAIVLWSGSVALGRSLAEQLGAWRAGALTYLLAGLILLVGRLFLPRRSQPPQKRRLRYLFGCGLLFVLYMVSLYLALERAAGRSEAIVVGLLNYLWPALTLLFSLFILGYRSRWGLGPGTLLALAGVYLAMTQGGDRSLSAWIGQFPRHPLVYGLGLLAAVAWALYSTLSRRWGSADAGSAVPYFALASGLVFLLIDLLRPTHRPWQSQVLAEIAVLALATALGYLFWDKAIRVGNLVLVASASYLAPFLSTVVSSFYLHVVPGPRLWLGCLLIIAGSLLSASSVHAPDPAR